MLAQKRQEHEKQELNQDKLQKDFPATRGLQVEYPGAGIEPKVDDVVNPRTIFNKVPASLVAKKALEQAPQKLSKKAKPTATRQKKAQVKANIRLLTADMVIEQPKEAWRKKLSLLDLEKEEIHLLMKEVKEDVKRQLPVTIPELVEKFLNQRLDSILQRKTFKDS